MAEVSVGGAISEGFSLIRREPVTVMLWGVAQLAFIIVVSAILGPLWFSTFQAVRSGADPATIQQSLGPVAAQMQGLSFVVDILEVGFYSVIYCAVFRAVLHPERKQFAYLRVGLPELLVGALLVGGYLVFVVGLVIAVIVVGIIAAIFVAVHLVWVAVIIGIVGAIAAFVAAFYLLLRVSLVGPMMVDEGQFRFGEAWKLSRGHVGSLFLIGLVLGVTVLIAEILVGVVLVAIGAGVLVGLAGGAQNLPTFFQQPPSALFARLGPLLVLAAVIWTPLVGCLLAIMGAPWARAYRDLKPSDTSAVSAVFA